MVGNHSGTSCRSLEPTAKNKKACVRIGGKRMLGGSQTVEFVERCESPDALRDGGKAVVRHCFAERCEGRVGGKCVWMKGVQQTHESPQTGQR